MNTSQTDVQQMNAQSDSDELLAQDQKLAAKPFDAAAFAETFSHRTLQVNDAKIHYVTGGRGPVLLLIHGWPASWFEYRKAMPLLAEHFTVIAPDLPGMGDSSAPSAFDKKTVAGYFAAFLEALEHDAVFVAAHDMGGPVAFALAANFPQKVKKLLLMETMIASDEQNAMQINAFPALWHLPFNATPGLAETLVAGRERLFLSEFFTSWSFNPSAISREDMDEYERTYAMPGKIGSACSYYRTFAQDAQDNQTVAGANPLPMPVLFLPGQSSMGSPMMGDPENNLAFRSFAKFAPNAQMEIVPSCGHWVAEERPVYLAQRLIRFFE